MSEIVIEQLDYPQNIRHRPEMYIGSTDNADVIFREIVDNSFDEVHTNDSPCDKVAIWNNQKYFIVADNGRGLPITKSNNDESMTMAVQSATVLHAGSKFSKKDFLKGTFGVGSSATSALSNEYWIFARLTRDKVENSTNKVKKLCENIGPRSFNKYFYVAKIVKGILEIEEIWEAWQVYNFIGVDIPFDAMTIIAFIPDTDILVSPKARIPDSIFYEEYISKSNYGKDLKIYINGNEYTEGFKPYKYQLVTVINSSEEKGKRDRWNEKVTVLCSFELDKEKLESPNWSASINGLNTNEGYHKRLVDYAFKTAFEKYYRHDFHGYHLWGIFINCVCLAVDPSFDSQTKIRCSGIIGITYNDLDPLINQFTKIIKENEDEFNAHCDRLKAYISSLQNIGKIDLIKNSLPIVAESNRAEAMIPLKLVDCTTDNREEAELYIVEGSSAAGSLRQARNPEIHAVLPLRGKVKNIVGAGIEEALDNQEIHDILASIGTGVDEYFNLDRIRYGKIILLADRDSDGSHILALLCGVFYSHLKYLIEKGYVYIVDLPLYFQDGNYYRPDELDKMNPNRSRTRFKGLGEMQPYQLKKTALDKDSRKLIQVTLDEDLSKVENLLTQSSSRAQLMRNKNIINDSVNLKKDMING